MIFYTFTTISLFKHRKSKTGEETGDIYKVPLYPVLPAIYLVGIVGLLFFRAYFEWEKSLVDLAFVATGLPFAFYWVYRGKISQK